MAWSLKREIRLMVFIMQ